MTTHIAPCVPTPGASPRIGATGAPATPNEHDHHNVPAAYPIRSYAAPRPQPLRALRARKSYPVVIGVIRPDLHACRNQAIASAVTAADLHAIQATADQHQWRIADVLRLQPGGNTDSTNPVERLLLQVRSRGADAVVVPCRLHLQIGDFQGRDGLEAVRRECAVVTLSPEQVWPCTIDFIPGFGSANATGTASSPSAPPHRACTWSLERW